MTAPTTLCGNSPTMACSCGWTIASWATLNAYTAPRPAGTTQK